MTNRPNVLFILSDDHAAHAISAYGSRINKTPNLDRIAEAGVRCDHCFCTNSICTPSRASILTGQHTHVCGVRTLHETLDNQYDPQMQCLFQEAGYRTGMFGKWHLGHGDQPDGTNADPAGFDEWAVLPGQGDYYDPAFIVGSSRGRSVNRRGQLNTQGYVTDLTTDLAMEWLGQSNQDQPFFLCLHHKAPHRHWEPGPQEKTLYEGETIPEPETLWDDYATRPAAAAARMRIDQDLNHRDVKGSPPQGLSPEDRKRWYYDRYIKDYLRCVAGIDRNVGRVLDHLESTGELDNTIVVYTSDQGFFLGDHGWYDKRFIYEHSLQMPLLIAAPGRIKSGSTCESLLTNVDFAPTLLQYAGLDVPDAMQGQSFAGLLDGDASASEQEAIYYRYWMDSERTHFTSSHYGVRTKTHKLIYYYCDPLDASGTGQVNTGVDPYWELFDLTQDLNELRNIFGEPGTESITAELHKRLRELQNRFEDTPAKNEVPIA